MKKLFNNKMMKVYIVLLCFSFLAGIVSAGFSISYSSQLTKLQEELEAASGNDATSAIVDMLANALSNKVQENADIPEAEETLTPEEEKLQSSKTASLVVMIVFLVFGVLFSAGAITSYQYEKYLQSDKYKAKLKRLRKYEKFKKA